MQVGVSSVSAQVLASLTPQAEDPVSLVCLTVPSLTKQSSRTFQGGLVQFRRTCLLRMATGSPNSKGETEHSAKSTQSRDTAGWRFFCPVGECALRPLSPLLKSHTFTPGVEGGPE